MSHAELQGAIDAAWDERDRHRPGDDQGEVREAVEAALDLLDRGELRVAERGADGVWHVNEWAKKAVLLSLPPERDEADRRRPGRRQLVGQGALQVRRLGREPVDARPASAPCRTASCGAAPISRRASC